MHKREAGALSPSVKGPSVATRTAGACGGVSGRPARLSVHAFFILHRPGLVRCAALVQNRFLKQQLASGSITTIYPFSTRSPVSARPGCLLSSVTPSSLTRPLSYSNVTCLVARWGARAAAAAAARLSLHTQCAVQRGGGWRLGRGAASPRAPRPLSSPPPRRARFAGAATSLRLVARLCAARGLFSQQPKPWAGRQLTRAPADVWLPRLWQDGPSVRLRNSSSARAGSRLCDVQRAPSRRRLGGGKGGVSHVQEGPPRLLRVAVAEGERGACAACLASRRCAKRLTPPPPQTKGPPGLRSDKRAEKPLA